MRICLRHNHNETRTDVDSRGALAIGRPFVGHALREFLESQNDTFLLERAPSLPSVVGPHPIADNHNFSLTPTKINRALRGEGKRTYIPYHRHSRTRVCINTGKYGEEECSYSESLAGNSYGHMEAAIDGTRA
jgi:hypothetical protein